MEKRIKTIDVKKVVKAGTKNIEVFIAVDGKEFEKEKECIEYEKGLEKAATFSKIETKSVVTDLAILEETWYYANDENQLKMILDYMMEHWGHTYINDYDPKYCKNPPKVGDWICRTVIDGGDCPDTINIYTLSYIKEEFEKFFNNFKQDE